MMPARCIGRFFALTLSTLCLGFALPPPAQDPAAPRGLAQWPSEDAEEQLAREARLLAAISPERLSAWHDAVASFPHVAGTPGDSRMVALLAEAFGAMGLEVEVHPFVAYLTRPIEARLALVSPAEVELSLKEVALPGVPTTALAELDFGWNAYSGSGTVEAELVYANYGRKEDFEALARLGVDCTGKLVIARYGGNYRGFKAKYAEEAGAAGLVIYTDPRDSGYGKGFVWPEGGWANDTCIQRGSIVTLPWIGDPLTPGVEATADAPRLDPESVALPRIPVQPIGWAAALQLLGPMRGESAPQDWQGGLPLRYRLTGGPDVRARLTVRQERALVRSANVLATLRGRDAGGDAEGARGTPFGPRVLIGSHHDAWGYGASDPTCGLIAVLEAARVFSEDAHEHGRLRRSITFAAWGAEEFGIIGSAEYVESRRAELTRDGVLYVNLDAASNGLTFSAAATPEARALVADALASVPQPVRVAAATADDAGAAASAPAAAQGALQGFDVAGPDGARGTTTSVALPIVYRGTVLETWAPDSAPDGAADAALRAPFGELGGGSDHAPFLALTGIPGVNLSAHGAEGTAYHSIYDDLVWYRATVGADYASARMIARATAVIAARAAEAPLAAISLVCGPAAAAQHLAGLAPPTEGSVDASVAAEDTGAWTATTAAFTELTTRATALETELTACAAELTRVEGHRRAVDELLRAWPRAWLDEAGLPGRTWFKNLYVAPDETSGYASWTLPGLRRAVLSGDSAATRLELERLQSVAARLAALLERLAAELREGE
jgi:N-acetylated-alpha-linked acidic dipeptidase